MVDYSLIPEPVRDLLRERVHALEHIEILLRLREQAPSAQGIAALAAAVRVSESLVESALAHLVQHGLVAPAAEPRAFLYAPDAPQVAAAVDALAACYPECRVEVLRLISSNAIERLRSGSLKIFAEAFRLRRKKKDG